MMSIYLMTYSEKFSLGFRSDRLIPYSCKALRVKLDRRIPANWSSRCEKNSLFVEINGDGLGKVLANKNDKKAFIFRELANSLMIVATHSPSDNLERTDEVLLRFHYQGMAVNALTAGKDLVKLQGVQDKELIAKHLRSTVKIQE